MFCPAVRGFDVMAGDNGIITRTLVAGRWKRNTFNDGIQHERIILLDIDSDHTALVSGGDVMTGDDDDDVMYGQGGDDKMHGARGHDYMEGNAGNDTMAGDAGQDDLVGGTGRVGDDPETGVPGRLDGDDTIYGESDTAPGVADDSQGPISCGSDGRTIGFNNSSDVILGDNGIIERPLAMRCSRPGAVDHQPRSRRVRPASATPRCGDSCAPLQSLCAWQRQVVG